MGRAHAGSTERGGGWRRTGLPRLTGVAWASGCVAAMFVGGGQLAVYDPQVEEEVMFRELSMGKFEWDHPGAISGDSSAVVKANVTCCKSMAEACEGAHAVVILTEWDEFKVCRCDARKAFRRHHGSGFEPRRDDASTDITAERQRAAATAAS